MTASYSPEDNKLRLYASTRFDAETYAKVKAQGFKWAPKQDLFVAPMWTPERADLLLELCGEIGDEDTSLVDRAEARADRFTDYSANRAQDAESARKAVDSIADHIPLGQPILVGHHSEKRARKDAEKIQNGMTRAVKMWDQAQYWKSRAAGAIHAAKYKERPDVRARRIKTLEADQRSHQREKEAAEKVIKAWSADGLTFDRAVQISNYFDHTSKCFTLAEYPREAPKTQYEGMMSLWSALTDGIITAEQARQISLPVHHRIIERADRWLEHIGNRLEYERAMLAEHGGTVADKTGPEKGGAVRCWASPGYGAGWAYIQKVNKVSITLLDNWGNGGQNFTRTIEFDQLKAVMTKAQVDEARAAGKLKEIDGGRGFYLMQTREEFEAGEPKTPDPPPPKAKEPPQAESFESLREALKLGVKVAVVNQLFPTPLELAARMAREAHLTAGLSILEPSAGTGVLLDTLTTQTLDGWIYGEPSKVVAIEINPTLAKALRAQYAFVEVKEADFMKCEDLGEFDRILMNPPFANGEDIERAFTMLKPGGRLVAICANGPRQQEKLKSFVEAHGGTWEDLPEGTFEDSGTTVNTALLVVDAPEKATPPAPSEELAVLDALPEAEEWPATAPEGFSFEYPMTGGTVRLNAAPAPFPGMAGHIEAQKAAAAAKQGENLTEKFNRPPADVSTKAGEIERKGPLFRDTEASGQGRLF